MTEYRGISGTYSDFKLVKTRGVVQVIVEFPIEEANQVLESLDGLPMPGQEAHVSLGLRSKLIEIAEGKAVGPERHANLSLVGKQRYAEADEMKQAVTRSVLLAKDPQFIAWLNHANATQVDAAEFIRRFCLVKSRSEIGTDEDAFRWFLQLERKFQGDVGRIAENRG